LAAYFDHDGSNGWIYSDVFYIANEAQASDGGPTDPSYTFINDGDTGMYRYSGNAIGFAAGGSLAAVINSTSFTIIGSYLYFNGVTGTEYLQFDDASNYARFVLDAGERFRVHNSYVGIGNGTVGTPGLVFISDTDTGIYRNAANYMSVAAGGFIIQQWGYTGSAKEIYFYGLSAGSTNYVRYNGASGLLQYSSSTIRIKKDIEPMPVGLTDLMPGGQWYTMRHNDEIDNPPTQRVPTEDGGFEDVPLLVGEEDQGKKRGGVIAEWTAAVDERFGIYNEGDDQPINYEMEALVGAILTDLQDTRKRLDAHLTECDKCGKL
jgi:hypothetical protein